MNKREFLKRTLWASTGTVTAISATPLARATASLTPATFRDTLIPNIALKTQGDNVVHLYDDLIKDKVVLFNFFYIRCRDTCSMTTYNLTRVQKLLGDRVGKSIFMYSISLDPDNDRPAMLQSYIKLFNIQPGWTLLTGSRDSGNQAEIDYLRRRLGFAEIDPALDRQRSNHTGMLRFGNEARGQWGAMPATMAPRLLAKEILWLVPDLQQDEQRRLSQQI